MFHGAPGRGRTDTVSLPLDFESSASAYFTTGACITIVIYALIKSKMNPKNKPGQL